MIEIADQWKLKLYGGFELIAPGGQAVRLPYRSAQALVAILALNRDAGVGREELGRILWPGSPPAKRQENLRQALAAARTALGPQRIEATRVHCRLAGDFSVVTDHEDLGLRGPGAFMPGFEGEWFDCMGRRNLKVPTVRLLDSFVHLLMWLADHDPVKMLGHMRDNHGLTFGISYHDRRQLLAKASDDPSLAGWKVFLGTAMGAACGDSSERVLRRHSQVVAQAEANNDAHLAVHASSQASLYYAWQNRFPEAMAAADWCLATATSTPDREVWATATQMKGNILVQSGKLDEGLGYLERAEQMYRDPIDSAIMRALRGYYLASMGRRDEAKQLLDPRLHPNLGAGHYFLNITWDLADAIATAKDKHPAESLEEFEKILVTSHAYGDEAVMLQVEEEVAKAFGRVGENAAAEFHMGVARQIRQTHIRPYTPWDKMRLAS